MKFKLNPGEGTLMPTLFSLKNAQSITIDAFHQQIVEGRYRPIVERIQQLDKLGQDCTEEKKKLPLFVVQGVCIGQRKLGSLTHPTGYAPFDIDHITAVQTKEIMAQLATLPWVKECHRSCRGGIHCVVAIGIIDHPQTEPAYVEEYRRRYALVAAELAALTSVAVDGQCKDALRGLFASYDPEAFLRPDGLVEAFDFPEAEMPTPECEPKPPTSPIPTTPPTPLLDSQQTALRFLGKHIYKPNHRHEFWVMWGRHLKYIGTAEEQLDDCKQQMVDVLIQQGLVAKDDPLRRSDKEVAEAMQWGYAHSIAAHAYPTNEESENDLIRSLPVFPEEVYANLPQLLQRSVDWIEQDGGETSCRRRDALLMAALVQFSALSGNTRIPYGVHTYSPNLGFILLSPPGNGKSIIQSAFRLVDAADRQQMEQSKQQIEAFHRCVEEWEREQREAARTNRKPNEAKRPTGTEPRIRVVSMSSSTSKSQLVRVLESSSPDGIVMNSTELATMIAALGQDVGKYVDLLCKVTMNEPIDQYYKVDEHPIKIAHPRLSLCLSGTLEQFHRFVPTVDDGLFSRFLIMMVAPNPQWISQRPHAGGFDAEQHFEQLGKEALDMWNYLRLSPTLVEFTDEQWRRHDEMWGGQFNAVLDEGGQDRISLCTRQGLAQMRIAGVLTVMRKWEEVQRRRLQHDTSAEMDFQQQNKVRVCSDTDFQTALHITDTLLKHSLMLSTTKTQQQAAGTLPMRTWKWTSQALKQLPEVFTTSEFLHAAKAFGRSQSQAYRSLSALHRNGIIHQHDEHQRTWSRA